MTSEPLSDEELTKIRELARITHPNNTQGWNALELTRSLLATISERDRRIAELEEALSTERAAHSQTIANRDAMSGEHDRRQQ